jgi:hypothetical protein
MYAKTDKKIELGLLVAPKMTSSGFKKKSQE